MILDNLHAETYFFKVVLHLADFFLEGASNNRSLHALVAGEMNCQCDNVAH